MTQSNIHTSSNADVTLSSIIKQVDIKGEFKESNAEETNQTWRKNQGLELLLVLKSTKPNNHAKPP